MLELRQPYGAFRPHASVLFPQYRNQENKVEKTGQTLAVHNDTDNAPGGKPGGIVHNTKWPFENITTAPGDRKANIELTSSKKPVVFQCSIHPWMHAYVWVFDHPYFAVTDENGEFEIKNVPAGGVRVVAWHEGAAGNYLNSSGPNGERIELRIGGTTKDFTAKK